MNQSGYDSTTPLIEKRAAGYDTTLDGVTVRNLLRLDSHDILRGVSHVAG